MPLPVLQPVRPIFRAIAATVVPEAAALDATGWADLEAIVETAIAKRAPAQQKQLVLFLRLVQTLSLMRFGRTFTALDPSRRTALLGSLERAPAALLRRGMWGVRTLAFMGYYARPAAGIEIGYRASARGWHLARATLGAVDPSLPNRASEPVRG